jgi:SMC interacting uncharacterized protein involved in chromosome segregation
MNAAEQRTRHTQLAQLASDTAKAFEDMNTVIEDLHKDLDQVATDLDDLDTKVLDRDLQEARRINGLFEVQTDETENVSRRLTALADRYYADHTRTFFGRMKLLFLGR